jgi:hypothetical protein
MDGRSPIELYERATQRAVEVEDATPQQRLLGTMGRRP